MRQVSNRHGVSVADVRLVPAAVDPCARRAASWLVEHAVPNIYAAGLGEYRPSNHERAPAFDGDVPVPAAVVMVSDQALSGFCA